MELLVMYLVLFRDIDIQQHYWMLSQNDWETNDVPGCITLILETLMYLIVGQLGTYSMSRNTKDIDILFYLMSFHGKIRIAHTEWKMVTFVFFIFLLYNTTANGRLDLRDKLTNIQVLLCVKTLLLVETLRLLVKSFIGLTRSENTSLMATPKRPGVQICQMNLHWLMEPPVPEQKCHEYQYTKIGRWTYFGWWTPQYQNRDALNTSTQNLADKPTLANGPPQGKRAEMPSHCYWHLVVRNGNFTLLLTSSCQERQFHIATTPSGQEWQFLIATDI